jgi:D-apiose dehydrogenase
MNRRLRVAMAGAGFASALHLAGWARLRDAEVVAICDPDASRASERAGRFGIPEVYRDAATMLDATKPDALDIAAPLASHVPLCLLAADRGIDVLCQKPLAPSLEAARALARAVDGRIRLMVHENWRFRAEYRQIKQWLDAGHLGEPVSCTLQVRASGLLADGQGVLPQLVRQPFCATLERFLIGEVLIHHLDVLRWLLGPLRVVAARIGRQCPAVRGEDAAAILLEGQGRWACLDGSFVVPGASPTPTDRLELIGARGTAQFDGETVRLAGARQEANRIDTVAGYGDSYAAVIAHFAAALASGGAFETDLQDNLQTLALVEEAYRLALPPG